MEGPQNFLHKFDENPQPKKTRQWWQILAIPFSVFPTILLTIAIVLIVVVVVGLFLVWPSLSSVQTISSEAMNAKKHLEAAQDYLIEQDFVTAKTQITAAKDSFSTVNQELDELGTKKVFQLPYIKKQINTVRDITLIGENTAGLLEEISELGDEVLQISNTSTLNFKDITEEQKVQVLNKLVATGQSLKKSEPKIVEVESALVRLQPLQSSGLWQDVVVELNSNIPPLMQGMRYIITASDILPELAGLEREKVYLFLLQNNSEMRPSGGFIGTYGIIKVKNGELASIFTDNIYNLDQTIEGEIELEPPYPITKYMGQDHWYMRDSNWWPDFPTSAVKVEEFYHLEGGPEPHLDGVIAINPNVISDFLGIVGDITVAGITFTKDNFVEELQYQVELGFYEDPKDFAERKEIISHLADEIKTRIFNLKVVQFPAVFETLNKNLEEKFIIGYFDNKDLQSYMEKENWGGVVRPTPDDFLMVVDANLAALKTDRVMQRQINYSVRPANDRLLAETKLTYINNGWFDWRTTRYRSYTRVYTPAGSQLQSITVGNTVLNPDAIDTYNEFGKTAFGFFFEVEPGTRKTIILQYLLPDSVEQSLADNNYSLLIQKQAGIPELELSLSLNLGEPIIKQSTGEILNSLDYLTTIKKDELLTVKLK
ncbi:hypothetical protein COT97_00180 [Candidatus Falkowbacteria bacterium CG10_big_fil_rev_8_21_14_0_10_39_11]|uniref:DUF4012 domain-containing protein n=1 Tax=Candidatus Falkowbacteria bacterium CG10_big_fil_rev_8_21_14_0_10_39_11 TaxID=1974565 RepID=A0A2H0V6G6_9BACT|nr:MAG: hypothetical protein COT97_00180 [Candidatus Falkowbacteria bacterium CG10_big_fil_rev_8_21_14_0_10_39_11]